MLWLVFLGHYSADSSPYGSVIISVLERFNQNRCSSRIALTREIESLWRRIQGYPISDTLFSHALAATVYSPSVSALDIIRKG